MPAAVHVPPALPDAVDRRARVAGTRVTFLAAVLAMLMSAAAPRGASAQPGPIVTASERFELHSDPWINLHHFLYQWARADLGVDKGRRQVPVRERSSIAQLSAEQRQAWQQAVDFYRTAVATKGHFDAAMLQLKDDLLDLDGNFQARPAD